MPSPARSDDRPDRGASRDRGQATVELALVLPLILVLLLAVVQVGVVVRNELAVELAAREGARAASVAVDPAGAAATAAQRSVDLPITVATRASGGTVTVTVTHVDHSPVPILGPLIGTTIHTATITMTFEPPPGL